MMTEAPNSECPHCGRTFKSYDVTDLMPDPLRETPLRRWHNECHLDATYIALTGLPARMVKEVATRDEENQFRRKARKKGQKATVIKFADHKAKEGY